MTLDRPDDEEVWKCSKSTAVEKIQFLEQQDLFAAKCTQAHNVISPHQAVVNQGVNGQF